MRYYRREERIFGSDDEIESVVVTMCGEGHMLYEIGAVENEQKLLCVRVRKVVDVNVEVSGYEEVMWGGGSKRDEGVEVVKEVGKRYCCAWGCYRCGGFLGGEIVIPVNIENSEVRFE